MSILISAISVFLLYGLNIGIIPLFPIVGIVPNFIFIFFIIYAFETKYFPAAFFLSLLSGLILDFSSEVYAGSFLFAFFLVLFILRFFTSKIFILEKNIKNTYIIFTVFFIFVYGFVFLYNFYAIQLGLRHLTVWLNVRAFCLHLAIEFLLSLPFIYLFRRFVYWQFGFLNTHFYANTKKTF